jgi:RHS repeat-associated protein
VALTYNGSNRITTSGYAYDAAGNLAGDGTNTYYWDAESHLITVMNGLGTISINTYNALGQRVRDMTPTGLTEEAYGASGELLWRFAGSSSDPNQRAFVSFSGGILAEYYSGGTIFDHPDQIGSMSTASDYTGNNFNEKLFYPFGELWTGAALPSFNMHQTSAHLPDYDPETDQYNTLNRHYSPSGRWLSPDPGGVKIVKLDDPQTWNMYAYVRNNPTTLTDPTGLEVPASCAKDPKCTIVVKMNVIYDQTVNRGKGLTSEQKQKFQEAQLAKAQKDYGTSNIKLDVTYTAGRYDVGPNGNPVITGSRSGFLNLVVSNGTPSGAAGDSGADRRTGLAISFLNINDAAKYNLYPLSMNTTEHELGHQFLGHVYMNSGGFLDTFGKEFAVDNRLFGQTLGISQEGFRVGLEPRDYATPADGPDQ